MLSIHDQITHEMCDRLETTAIGLGLVRLLQDAKRFDEARMMLHALEDGVKPTKHCQKPCKRITRPAPSTRFTRIGAA
jgi:predicted N-formylglutamate amidohydrolase